MPELSTRQPHAVLDLPSRRWKGMKIEQLLGLDKSSELLKLLEIGAGSGGIANYFGTHPSGRFTVDAVDVVDNRLVTDGFTYRQVEDTSLPFADESFDVVITNHVIEHVGDRPAQLAHLSEVARVLRHGGLAYLAVPNRWMVIEPHFQLAFLSWMPPAWRTPYLRASGKGSEYDCRPLQVGQLEAMLTKSGFAFSNLCIPALRTTLAIERPNAFKTKLFEHIPNSAIRPVQRLIPTLIYKLWHAGDARGSNG